MLADTLETPPLSSRQGSRATARTSIRTNASSGRHLHRPSLAFWPLAVPASSCVPSIAPGAFLSFRTSSGRIRGLEG